MTQDTEVKNEEVKVKKDIKIKAKCSTCRKRLFTNDQGAFCKQGHPISTPLTYRFSKSDNPGPKWRRRVAKQTTVTDIKKRR